MSENIELYLVPLPTAELGHHPKITDSLSGMWELAIPIYLWCELQKTLISISSVFQELVMFISQIVVQELGYPKLSLFLNVELAYLCLNVELA